MTAGNDPAVSPSRPSPLGDRIDKVCEARGLSDHRWSLAAGYSKTYMAQIRKRAADSADYELPEKTAAALAAAANVNAEWLRWGRGVMEGAAPPPTASRQALIDTLARSASEFSTAGDLEGARIAAEALQRLLGQPSRVLEHDAEASPEESHQRRKFQPPPPKTGT